MIWRQCLSDVRESGLQWPGPVKLDYKDIAGIYTIYIMGRKLQRKLIHKHYTTVTNNSFTLSTDSSQLAAAENLIKDIIKQNVDAVETSVDFEV